MLNNCPAVFPNPHAKRVQELLSRFVICDNKLQRSKIELKCAQTNFIQSMDNINFQYRELKKLDCAAEGRLNAFQQNVESMNSIKDIENKYKNILEDSKKLLEEYNKEKVKLKQFHHDTVDYLKSFAIQNHDPEIIRKCNQAVQDINKNFANDISYINECENVLFTFNQLQYERRHVPQLDELARQIKGNSAGIVDSTANEIRNCMGRTLRKAFAHLYIHQPLDKEKFLVQYLLTDQHNDKVLEERLERLINK